MRRMEQGRSLRSRAEVWIYRRLRPLVIEQEELSSPAPGGPNLLEEQRSPVPLARLRKVAAGAVLVAVVGTGGAWFGYGQGHEAGELEAVGQAPLDRGGLPGWTEDVCRDEASWAGFERCRAEMMTEAAELQSKAMHDQVGN